MSTLLKRINNVINDPIFEEVLNEHGFDLFFFQTDWATYGSPATYDDLPEPYRVAIAIVEQAIEERIRR